MSLITSDKILELQPQEIQDIFAFFSTIQETDQPAIIDQLTLHLSSKYNFPQIPAKRLAIKLYHFYTENQFYAKFSTDSGKLNKTMPPLIYLSRHDLDMYLKYTQADPNITPLLRVLLFACIAVFRTNYHHSGWIKFDRQLILYAAGLPSSNSNRNISKSTISFLFNKLHTDYGLNMRVVGSNQPITCFQFDWLLTQPIGNPGSRTNPLYGFDILSPLSKTRDALSTTIDSLQSLIDLSLASVSTLPEIIDPSQEQDPSKTKN